MRFALSPGMMTPSFQIDSQVVVVDGRPHRKGQRSMRRGELYTIYHTAHDDEEMVTVVRTADLGSLSASEWQRGPAVVPVAHDRKPLLTLIRPKSCFRLV